jgi:hypothetical protein
MVYTDIQTLRGLDVSVDYGSGVEYADGILNLFADIHALQIGLWLNGTAGCRDVVTGVLQTNIQQLLDYLVSCKAQRIFLRVGYEFDNPAFGYYYDDNDYDTTAAYYYYRAAFQKLVEACRAHSSKRCDDKVDFVWHSWGAGLGSKNATLRDFYPGDDFVDWVGVSLFTQFYPNSQTGSAATVLQVLDMARLHNKPIMIAESTPYGGIDRLSDPWNEWFLPVLDLIVEYDIGMWSFINCDWTSQPMWKFAGFGDTRLSINQTVMGLWHRNVVQNPRFKRARQIGSLSHCRERKPRVDSNIATKLEVSATLSLTGIFNQSLCLFDHWSILILAALAAIWYQIASRSQRRASGPPDEECFVCNAKTNMESRCRDYGSLD